MKILERPLRICYAAAVLLGSASERLSKEPKRDLAAKIVKLTSLLLDKLMRLFARVDFGKMKSEILSDSNLREIFGLAAGSEIPTEQRDFIVAILDAYEFSMLGYPIRSMFALLGNAAGQPVLRPSVSSVTSPDTMENLVARIWSADINAAKEKGALNRALSDLPEVPFLRFTLSSYFVTRVFWNHWELNNRLALLDAADVAIDPFNDGVDKGRVKRAIERKQKRKGGE